jgi:hypothetical protein
MPLPAPSCTGHGSTPKLPTTSGHTCLTQGNSLTFDIRAHSGTASFSAVIRGSALALRVHSLILQRGGRHLVAETDSAANQFGAHGTSRTTPARHISVVCGPCLPLAHLSDIWIGERL